MQNKPLKIVGQIIVIVAIFYAGYLLGFNQNAALANYIGDIANKEPETKLAVDFAPFWKAWSLLEENYLPDIGTSTATSTHTEITDQKKVWSAIDGLARTYEDPYTAFFPPQENEIFKSTISGNFEGVGMEIANKEDNLTVVSPLKNSPAEKAGIKSGDRVVKIDGVDSVGMIVEEAIKRIRGPKGTTVVLTVLREGSDDPISISIVRDVITIPTVETKLVNTIVKNGEEVFVIRLYSFSAVSGDMFRKGLQEFNNSKATKLVIDLRGNPGGYLESAVHIASFFLPAGKLIVSETSSKKENSREFRSSGFTDFYPKIQNAKIVVLVDQGSASASEILAGALSENGVAKLVGKRTFGKGSVQQLFDVTDKTSIKITVARWLTPTGRSISKSGITPDYEVDITKEDIQAGKDPQLDKAVEVLLAK